MTRLNQEGGKTRINDSLELNIIRFFNMNKGSRNMEYGGMIEILEHEILRKSVSQSSEWILPMIE